MSVSSEVARQSLTFRYPGRSVARIRVWAPIPGTGDYVKTESDGVIPPGLAKLIVAVQVMGGKVSEEVDRAMAELALKAVEGTPTTLEGQCEDLLRRCSCYDDGVMCVTEPSYPEHGHGVRP